MDETDVKGWFYDGGNFTENSPLIGLPISSLANQEFTETTTPIVAYIKDVFLDDNDVDIAPDEFSFSLNGMNGDFMLDNILN